MKKPPLDKDRLKSRLNEFLKLHGIEIKDNKFKCLWHEDTNPSMGIVPNGTAAHCFACDTNADIFKFAAYFYGLDEKRDFPQIVKQIQSEFGTASTETELSSEPVIIPFNGYENVYNKTAILKLGKYVFNSQLKENTALAIEAVYPCRSENGHVEFVEARFHAACFTDGKKKTAAMWFNGNNLKAKSTPHGLFGRELLKENTDKPILIVEGPKCQMAAADALPGFIPIAWNGGGNGQKVLDFHELSGRIIYIYPDDDPPGLKSAQTTAKKLNGIAKKIIIIDPLPEARSIKPSGADIVEALQVKSPDEIAAYIKGFKPIIKNSLEAAAESEEKEAHCIISSNFDDRQNALILLHSLKSAGGGLYLLQDTSDIIVSIQYDKGTAFIKLGTSDSIKTVLLKSLKVVCHYINKDGDKREKKGKIPVSILKSMIALPLSDLREQLPIIKGVVNHPIVTKNGIKSAGGYDEETGLFINTAVKCQNMSIEDAKAALSNIFCDFPFSTEYGIETVVMLALNLVSKNLYNGRTPAYSVFAPTVGTGKSLLIQALWAGITGRTPAFTPATADDEEMRKQITTALLAGDEYLILDNVQDGEVFNPNPLVMAITSGKWKERLLGGNTQFEAPFNMTVVLTGNNFVVKDDFARRIIPIHLKAKMGDETYKIENLIEYCLEHHERLVSSACTLAWEGYKSGIKSKIKLDGFESWAKTIGGIATFLNYHRFINGNTDLQEESQAAQYEGIPEFLKFIADKKETYHDTTELLAYAIETGLVKEGEHNAKSFGRHLKKIDGAWHGDYKLYCKTRNPKALWKIEVKENKK
ncbi:hypothetical protein FACS1894200_03100 [Spirochaetia bacterium]|nr:hypothetical protein FACS1894200_03100 [Spirochaetia bacterium]